MDVRTQRRMVARLKVLSASRITIGTACSGSDMILKVADALVRHWKALFGLSLDVKSEFACERDAKKQAFLKSQFQADCIFQDVSELSGARARDVVSGQARRVPAVDVFASGFSCVSRSKLNNHRKRNLNCVQTKQGETGTTLSGTVGYISTYAPAIVILENVVDLMQETLLSASHCPHRVSTRVGGNLIAVLGCGGGQGLSGLRTEKPMDGVGGPRGWWMEWSCW